VAREHSHAHDYDIRGAVLSGIFIVNDGSKPLTYRAGDIFVGPAGAATPRRSAGRARRSWWGEVLGRRRFVDEMSPERAIFGWSRSIDLDL